MTQQEKDPFSFEIQINEAIDALEALGRPDCASVVKMVRAQRNSAFMALGVQLTAMSALVDKTNAHHAQFQFHDPDVCLTATDVLAFSQNAWMLLPEAVTSRIVKDNVRVFDKPAGHG